MAVQGYCPACGSDGMLFLTPAGIVTCGSRDCPDRWAASDLLKTRIQPDRLRRYHTLTIKQDSWHMAHPLDCRLATCPFDAAAQTWDEPPANPGTYRWDTSDQLSWIWLGP